MKILALAQLTVLDAVRKKIFIVFLLLLASLASSAFFLPVVQASDRIKLVDSISLGWTTFFGMLIAIFLSAFGIPEEVGDRRAFTILTKPVRSHEFVLGKWIGYITVIGGIVLVTWLSTILSIWLLHPHDSIPKARQMVGAQSMDIPSLSLPDEEDSSDQAPQAQSIRQTLGKRPDLHLLDRNHPTAFWSFDNLDPSTIPEGESIGRLKIALLKTLRTHVEVVRTRLRYIHPTSGRQSTQELEFHTFGGQHQQEIELLCPRRFISNDGRLTVALDRLDPHFDLLVQTKSIGIYLSAESHAWNLGKAFLGSFLMLVLIISLTVFASTTLSGPVSVLVGLTGFIIGHCVTLMQTLARQVRHGEMTLERAFRQLLEKADQGHDHAHSSSGHEGHDHGTNYLADLLDGIATWIPDFTRFRLTDTVTNGVSIPAELLWQLTGTCVAYSAAALLLGIFFFAWSDVERTEGPWWHIIRFLRTRRSSR
ncbi:MAG: hypothetical protein QF752_02565 [Planctomycetota bacterium]|nr:hypothetical protein [Planctomycetota bacterium]